MGRYSRTQRRAFLRPGIEASAPPIGGRSVYCAYRVFSQARGLGASYLARWSLPSGRLVSTAMIDRAGVLAAGLIDAGARVAVINGRTITVFDAHSLRRLSSVAITPP